MDFSKCIILVPKTNVRLYKQCYDETVDRNDQTKYL